MPPSGTEPFPDEDRKKLRPVPPGHPIEDVWSGDLSSEVIAYLDEQKVRFTSIDLVRIGKQSDGVWPVVIWIGVHPKSLSGQDGHAVVTELHRCLQKRGLDDVEVEIRESVVWGTMAALAELNR